VEAARMNPISLGAKLATFSEHWQPRTVGQFNGHGLMVVKAQGEFVRHKHDDTDDFFLVLKGPMAKEEVHILLIEPAGTPNTGDPATAASRRVI
jgi:hypothetical protein